MVLYTRRSNVSRVMPNDTPPPYVCRPQRNKTATELVPPLPLIWTTDPKSTVQSLHCLQFPPYLVVGTGDLFQRSGTVSTSTHCRFRPGGTISAGKFYNLPEACETTLQAPLYKFSYFPVPFLCIPPELASHLRLSQVTALLK